MTNRLKAVLVPALAFLALGLALPAGATASPDDVLRDCAADGAIDNGYSRDDLRRARGQIEPDFAAYSDCDEILDARLGPQAGIAGDDGGPGGTDGSGGGDGSAAGSGSGGSGEGPGAGGFSAEEQRRRELARAQVEEELGERGFDPRSGAAINASDTSNGLSLPVLLALIALALLLASGAALAVGKRNPAFMGALRRVPFPRRGH